VVTLQGVTLAPPPGGIRPECPRVSNKSNSLKTQTFRRKKRENTKNLKQNKPKKPLSQEEKIAGKQNKIRAQR
jgi:hypothetical protein